MIIGVIEESLLLARTTEYYIHGDRNNESFDFLIDNNINFFLRVWESISSNFGRFTETKRCESHHTAKSKAWKQHLSGGLCVST